VEVNHLPRGQTSWEYKWLAVDREADVTGKCFVESCNDRGRKPIGSVRAFNCAVTRKVSDKDIETRRGVDGGAVAA
jgi:hypothetical protein